MPDILPPPKRRKWENQRHFNLYNQMKQPELPDLRLAPPRARDLPQLAAPAAQLPAESEAGQEYPPVARHQLPDRHFHIRLNKCKNQTYIQAQLMNGEDDKLRHVLCVTERSDEKHYEIVRRVLHSCIPRLPIELTEKTNSWELICKRQTLAELKTWLTECKDRVLQEARSVRNEGGIWPKAEENQADGARPSSR
jgi:hypothetical protein